MQQVAVAAIEAYVRQAPSRLRRRESVRVTELLDAFADLPPIDADAFRADQDRHIDASASLDAYERARGQEEAR